MQNTARLNHMKNFCTFEMPRKISKNWQRSVFRAVKRLSVTLASADL